MNIKFILGVIAAVISLVAYAPYFRDVYKHVTKPHIYTWLIWSFIVGLAFAAQIQEGAGSGAWVTGTTAIICTILAVVSIFYGERDIKRIDWICFVLSIMGLVGWQITNNALVAVLMVTFADALAFVPTMRKGYAKPFEDTIMTWVLNSLKFIIGLLALQTYSLSTYLYPATLVFTNALMAGILMFRRKQLPKNNFLHTC